MEGNATFSKETDNRWNEEIDKKNLLDALVQEELNFSHTQSSQQHSQNQYFLFEDKHEANSSPKSKEELLQNVILSLAMEQRAIAQFIQAEARHIQAYAHNEQEHNRYTTQQNFQADLVRIVEGLVEKQKMSMRLLDMTRVMLKED